MRVISLTSLFIVMVLVTSPITASDEVNVTRLQEVMTTLARQTMMQQLAMEERIRSGYHSGIKQIRFNKDGTRAFTTSSHTGSSIASIHDHTDHYKTVGIGEFVGVLNGVEFRSRHNDYMLRQPSKTSQEYKATDEIEYPDVPQAVLDQETLEDEITEMREWFKAWANQDDSKRDYTKHFKSLLCYLEATWTETDFGAIDEPFESDRHHVSADNWYDLQEKIRYTSYTGQKDKGENYAFLPTKIMDIDQETKEPVYAQWNYRILCHQMKDHFPLNLLHPTGDLHDRLARGATYDEYTNTRSARFMISKRGETHQFRWHTLESLMNEIPGLNNYQADIKDESFGRLALNPWSATPKPLNAGYYHRWYKFADTDAMGLGMGHRGFSDRNLFVAFNTQSNVSSVGVRYCERVDREQVCDNNVARVSYAVPMEIIYLTPLHKWNPYGIQLRTGVDGKQTTKGGRNGGFTADKAFDGANDRNYYRTPIEFFTGDEVNSDAADTAAAVSGVLDGDGNVRNVTASGVRIFLPEIPGIKGNLRTRYPIFPVHEEGSTAFKEVEALREIVMDIKSHLDMFEVLPPLGGGGVVEDEGDTREDTVLLTSMSTRNPPGSHAHSITLSYLEWVKLVSGGARLTRTTSEVVGHTHVIKFYWNTEDKKIVILKCDGKSNCWDGHDKFLYKQESDTEE